MSDDWDIEAYKTEFENEEHWELKRNFMLAHKDKFSEDELVCLAQVFANIEFLGCRYPDKTMIRVAELARGVVETFREKRKDSLKRTFVAASDAASAKVKGRPSKGEETEPATKIIKIDQEKTTNKSSNAGEKLEPSRRPKYGGVKTFEIEKNEKEQAVIELNDDKSDEMEVESDSDCQLTDEKLENFVFLMTKEKEHPVSLIEMNASLNKCSIKWEVEQGLKTCKLYLNGQCMGTGTGRTVKISKEEAAREAIAKLRKSCYGVRMKASSPEVISVHPSELGKNFEKNETTPSLGEDNIGRKLMKLMGWQGGGLGTKEQGMQQPVAATLHVRKDGLGLKKVGSNVKEFKKQAREYIQSWAKSDSHHNLVFSTDFTSEERKIMHNIAKNLALKSKSYGKDSDRHLIISRKPQPGKILEELLKLGGDSDRYELLPPTKD